jgi:hypothetical protein
VPAIFKAKYQQFNLLPRLFPPIIVLPGEGEALCPVMLP